MLQATQAPIHRVELATDATGITVLPQLGGKIASLVVGGREWLWTSDVVPWRLPVPGTSYVLTADSGGWDECFPTVGECTLESGMRLPDHGELWSQAAAVEIDHGGHGDGDDTAQSIVTRWRARLLPARFERRVQIRNDGVRFSYRLRNDGDAPLPFLWSAHPLVPLGPDTRFELPVGAPVRVWAAHGLRLTPDPERIHRWPRITLDDGTAMDVSHPARARTRASGGDGWAVKLFMDVSRMDLARTGSPGARGGDVVARLHERSGSLSMSWDSAAIPTFGLWINNRGWTPFRQGAPYANAAFEPCIGAPDSLAAALGAWHGAHWLEPGAVRAWSLDAHALPPVDAPRRVVP